MKSCSRKDNLITLLMAAGITVGIAFVFYRSFYALVLGVVIFPFCIVIRTKSLKEARDKRMQTEFMNGMQMVSSALGAGYSIENAWRQAERNLERLHGKDSLFLQEMAEMNRRVRMNEPLEELFMEFAKRADLEDIYNFAEIFQHAKRSGGNLSAILRKTIQVMRDKTDIMAEIENAIAAKRMEQKLMNVMLPAILLFVTMTSPDYETLLYHNLMGVGIMSACLAGYLVSCFWAMKIINIKV